MTIFMVRYVVLCMYFLPAVFDVWAELCGQKASLFLARLNILTSYFSAGTSLRNVRFSPRATEISKPWSLFESTVFDKSS